MARFSSLRYYGSAALLLLIGACAAVQADTYTPADAMQALYMAKAGYCDSNLIKSWSCGETCDTLGAMTDITVTDNSVADSQAWVGYSQVHQQIVVAFRGSANIMNWINDLDFTKVPYPNTECVNCKVHQGFLEEWQSYSAQVLNDVQALRVKYPEAPLFVAGHSLGAAVSILAALDLTEKLGISPSEISLYNFGEPRVGDPTFVQWAVTKLNSDRQFRVTHEADPVPHLPPESFGFLHAPHELWYDNNGDTQWKDCQDSATAEDPNCSDSTLPIDIDDHLKYLGICTECSCSGDAKKLVAMKKPRNVSEERRVIAKKLAARP